MVSETVDCIIAQWIDGIRMDGWITKKPDGKKKISLFQ
jgi:hypothetical protein